MAYRLYGVQDFANLAVHLVLEASGADYEAVFLDPDQDLKSPAHLARHPLGLVPALDTPDGTMFETAAILLWLADRHPGLAPMATDPARAAFLSWFVFTNNSLHTGAMDLIHPHRPGGQTAARSVAELAHARLRDRLALIDRAAAQHPDWLTPERPGILAFYLAMLLRWVRLFPAYPDQAIASQDFPALHAIAMACETHPAALRIAAAHGLSGAFLSNPSA